MIKKLFVVALLFCSNLAFAQNSNLKIFFVNGIANSQIEAKNSAADLTKVLASLTGNVTVESIYNPTGKSFGAPVNGECLAFNASSLSLVALPSFVGAILPPSLSWSTRLVRPTTEVCIFSDLGELTASKLNEENYFSSYSASFVVGNNPQLYGNLNQSVARQFVNAYFLNEKPVVRAVAKQVATQVKNNIDAGSKVLVVAHSQGNLVANWAWVLLASELPEISLKKLRILNVANTSLYSPHSANITHSGDREIYGNLPRLGRLSLRRNSLCQPINLGNSNETCDFFVATPTYSITAIDSQALPKSHNFVSAYLSGVTITNTITGVQTSFANAIYSTTQSLLESMGALPAQLVNQPPTASFIVNPSSAAVNTAINFNASPSSDPDGSISSYAWNFGDGSSGTGVNAAHAYASVGSYTVTLTVTDNAGVQASAVRQVSITATPQPDLVPSLVTVSPVSVAPGGSVNVSWRITNTGNGNAAASTTGIRLIPAPTSGNGSAASTLQSVATGALASGGVANQTQAITIPAGSAPGNYVIVVIVDNVANSTLGQSNISNDFSRSSVLYVGSDTGNSPPSDTDCELAIREIIDRTATLTHVAFAVSENSVCKSSACVDVEIEKIRGMGLNARINDFSLSAGGFPLSYGYAPGCVGIRDDISNLYGFVSNSDSLTVETAAKCIVKKLGSSYSGPNPQPTNIVSAGSVIRRSCHADGFLFPVVVK